MRIDAYNQIAQLYGVSRTTKTAKTQSASRMSDQRLPDCEKSSIRGFGHQGR